MGDSLKISVIVDTAQVTAGLNGVTATVDAATARIKAAFGSIANAPEGIQNALKVLENQTRMSAEAVTAATAAISALGGASASAGPEVEAVGAAASATATQMTSMDRAMALATGRMTGFLGGAGMLGGALGRVGAASSALGPILAAAFPVVAVIAIIDVVDHLLDKLDDLAAKPDKVKIAWDELALKMDTDVRHSQEQLDRLSEKFVGLTQGPLAEMEAQLADIRVNFDGVDAAGNAAFASIEKGLKQADVSRFNPINWLNGLRDVNFGTKDLEPLARKINIALQEALISQDPKKISDALTSGLTQMTQQQTATIAALEKAEKSYDVTAIEAYQNRLQSITAVIHALQDLKKLQDDASAKADLEKKDNRAAQAKEYNRELEKTAELNDKLIADTKRMAEADLKALDEKKRLEKEAEQAVDKNDSAAQEIHDMRLRDEADEASVQARLGREKAASITSIEIEEEKVKTLGRLGQISGDEEAQRLNDLEAKKLQIETAYLQRRIETILARLGDDNTEEYKKDKAEWDRLLADKQKAEDTYQKNRQKNIDAAAVSEQKIWDKLGQGINRIFDQAVQGIVTGTERFGTAFAHILDGMLAKFIEAMLQMLVQWTLTHVLMIAVKQSAHEKEVLADAKSAAAAAWKATAGIPVIGPVLAPIAAATAFAGVEALSAEGGMVVPADNTLSLLHANEMVLPANISAGLKGLIGSGGGGGGVTISPTYNISAVDARGVEDVLTRSSAHLAKLMQRELRRANAI